MPAICSTVAELGVGDYDGHLKIIEFGPAAGPTRIGMRWWATPGLWIQAHPRFSFSLRDSWPVSGFSGLDWSYFTGPFGGWSGGQVGMTSAGWNPVAIWHVDSALAAGLIFQERLAAVWWQWDLQVGGFGPYDLATVYYEMDIGDRISTVISTTAGSYIGTQIETLNGVRGMQDSGWVKSRRQTSAKPIWTPHLYSRRRNSATDVFCEYLLAQWRWVGAPYRTGQAIETNTAQTITMLT